jgi:hypothetical protein
MDKAFCLPAPLKSTGSEIDEVMPPHTEEEAERFLHLLTEMTEQGNYEPLEGLDTLLPSSMVAARRFISDMKDFREVLPGLFQQFPEAFDEQIGAVLAAFHYHVWLVKLAVQILGVNSVVRRAMKFPEDSAFSFFVVLLSKTECKFECTSRLRRFLTCLAETFSDDERASVLRDFLNPPTEEEEELGYESLLAAVRERQTPKVHRIFQDLGPRIATDPALILANGKDLNQAFSEALTDGPRDLKILILDFCLSAVRDTGKACFIGLASSFASLLVEQDRSIVDLATECLSAMMEADAGFVRRVIKRVNGILEDDRERGLGLIGILHSFLEKLDEEDLVPYLEPAMQYLQPVLSSGIVSVRRVVLGLFAEFRYKIGAEFERFMPRFSANQQALIEKYCARRGPKEANASS